MTKKILFKNGKTLEVSQEVIDILKNKILSGSPKFQCVSDQNDKTLFIINVEEIVFVS